MELDRLNPVTLITGAASGFGAACARLLSRRSDGGLILIDGDETALGKTADSLSHPPERVSTLAFDVADAKRWGDAAEFLQAHYGRLDWAIVAIPGPELQPAAATDLVEWPQPVDDGLDTAFLSLRALMPLMRAHAQGGAILVTAPAAALKPRAGRAGLLQLIRAAAHEGARDNIRVNAVAPGGPDTPMWPNMPWFQDLASEAGSDEGALEGIAAMETRLARFAADGDVARLITLLLSDASALTGATLVVDGGYAI